MDTQKKPRTYRSVVATGVSNGDLLRGVRFLADSARTHSLVMCTRCNWVRFVDGIHFFARERRAHIDKALALSHAYRGTALLMSDLLEADDAYTGGEHSHGVVALALAVSAITSPVTRWSPMCTSSAAPSWSPNTRPVIRPRTSMRSTTRPTVPSIGLPSGWPRRWGCRGRG